VDDYCKVLKREIHLSNETITAFSSHAKGLWKSPRGTLIRIEFLVVLATLFFLILNGFGRYRRRSRNFFIQKGVLGAFTLSSSLMTYTLGSMQSSSVKSSMYSIWAISLFLLHGCTDSITAHTLRDNTEIRKLMFQAILYNLYGGFLIISGPIGILWKFVLFYYLYVLSIFKFAQRLFAYGLATGSCNIYKTVSDYMYQEHKMGGLFDPATMEGCHYLVDWPMGKSKLDNETCAREITADQSEVIDLEKIWLCRSLDPELKYECLSFSLFHLLRRRAFGFACGESKIKPHDFVFKGLLLDATNDYSRVFKGI
jgi:fluoride ion exporter CrcB/FEX